MNKGFFTLMFMIIAQLTIAIAHAMPPIEAAAEPLVKATYQPGYEMNPQRRTFLLHENGKMTLEVVSLRDGSRSIQDLGHLASAAMTNLKKDIDTIPSNAKLVDPRAGDPPCVDTPAISVFVLSKSKALEVYRRANCHKWDLDSYQGRLAAEFGALFLRFD
jgi:hypothetical protein